MKYIIIFLTVLFVVWFLLWKLPISGWHHVTGNGEQTGYVSAVEKDGLIWKTGRAYIKPTLESTQEDIYCVVDEDIYQTLSEKSKLKESVTVKHVSWISSGAKYCAGENAVITELITI